MFIRNEWKQRRCKKDVTSVQEKEEGQRFLRKTKKEFCMFEKQEILRKPVRNVGVTKQVYQVYLYANQSKIYHRKQHTRK